MPRRRPHGRHRSVKSYGGRYQFGVAPLLRRQLALSLGRALTQRGDALEQLDLPRMSRGDVPASVLRDVRWVVPRDATVARDRDQHQAAVVAVRAPGHGPALDAAADGLLG